LPGGSGSSDGYVGSAGLSGFWWSATEYGANYAWIRHMLYYSEHVSRINYGKTNLFSVRCVAD
jgi:uncharacterized protein (TIGR02145 family)